MANWHEPDAEQIKVFNEWKVTRPPNVQAMIEAHPPFKLYRMSDTGHRVVIRSYHEDGTVLVAVTAKYNLIDFERAVFGVDPATLTECDLPGPEEMVGPTMTRSQQRAMLDDRRAEFGRPPLTDEEWRQFSSAALPEETQ